MSGVANRVTCGVTNAETSGIAGVGGELDCRGVRRSGGSRGRAPAVVAASAAHYRTFPALQRYDRVRFDSLKAAAARLDGRQLSGFFEIRGSALSGRIGQFHALNHTPGWRNWQTLGT
jgi:hypothetical protein